MFNIPAFVKRISTLTISENPLFGRRGLLSTHEELMTLRVNQTAKMAFRFLYRFRCKTTNPRSRILNSYSHFNSSFLFKMAKLPFLIRIWPPSRGWQLRYFSYNYRDSFWGLSSKALPDHHQHHDKQWKGYKRLLVWVRKGDVSINYAQYVKKIFLHHSL